MTLERKLQDLTAENESLKIQNEQYRQILEQHNLLPKEDHKTESPPSSEINKNEVIRKRLHIYKTLFKGREDVFAHRWISGEQAGYAPVKSEDGSFAPLTEEVL